MKTINYLYEVYWFAGQFGHDISHDQALQIADHLSEVQADHDSVEMYCIDLFGTRTRKLEIEILALKIQLSECMDMQITIHLHTKMKALCAEYEELCIKQAQQMVSKSKDFTSSIFKQ